MASYRWSCPFKKRIQHETIMVGVKIKLIILIVPGIFIKLSSLLREYMWPNKGSVTKALRSRNISCRLTFYTYKMQNHVLFS